MGRRGGETWIWRRFGRIEGVGGGTNTHGSKIWAVGHGAGRRMAHAHAWPDETGSNTVLHEHDRQCGRPYESRTRRVLHYFRQQHYFQHAYRRFTPTHGRVSQAHETPCTARSWLICLLRRFAPVELWVRLEGLCLTVFSGEEGGGR